MLGPCWLFGGHLWAGSCKVVTTASLQRPFGWLWGKCQDIPVAGRNGKETRPAILLEHPSVGNGSVLPFGWTRAVLWGLVFAAGIYAHPVPQKQGCRCPPEHPLHPGEVSYLLSILDLAAQVFPV